MIDYKPTSKEIFYQMLKSPIVWVSILFIFLNMYVVLTSDNLTVRLINLIAVICFILSLYFAHASAKSWLIIKYCEKQIEKIYNEVKEDLTMGKIV